MELLLGVLVAGALIAGTVWTLKGLGMIRDFKSEADLRRRMLDAEVALHDLKGYIDQRTPNIPPGGPEKGARPPHIPGKDQEIDGFGSEVGSGAMMGPGELGG